MELKLSLATLILLLLSSHILSCAAIPTSRNLNMIRGDPSGHTLEARDEEKVLELDGREADQGRARVEIAIDYEEAKLSPDQEPTDPPLTEDAKMGSMDYSDPQPDPRHDPTKPPPSPPRA